MAKKQKETRSLDEQFAAFEEANPKIAEALRVFGMTMEVYQNALDAMESPRVYQSSSTAPMSDKERHVYLESRHAGSRESEHP